MKKITIKLIICFFIFTGCFDDNNLLEDIAVRGGFIQFEEVPRLNLNILATDTEIISEKLIDPNNNATSYSLALMHNGTVVNDFRVLTSFPTTLDFTIAELTSALGITLDDLNLDSKFTFVATIVTPTGTYSGLTPDYDSNNVNQGGNSTVRLKAAGLRDAIEFDVTFFQPPAKTVRKASFEEVAIGETTDTYDRNGGNNETGDLINGANPPYVDYTAVGTSATDELGFNTEYFAVSGISSSGLGFARERIGVFSLFEDYDEYPDGTKGYHIEDPDGGIRITFDTVTIPSGQNNSGVSFEVYFNDSSWESKDGLKAYVNVTTTTGSRVIEMANLYDDDIEAVAGKWVTFNTGFLKGILTYELVLEPSSGATPESFDFDNILIYVPED
jgi:hypothetical protein